MQASDKPAGVPITFVGQVKWGREEEGMDARRRVQPEKALRWVNRIQEIREGKPVGPVSVHLHLANACNHSCDWCAPAEYRLAHLTNVPKKVIDDLMLQCRELDVKNILLIGGGEPTVNPAIENVCVQARRWGQQLSLTTNAGLIHMKNSWMVAVRDCIMDGTIKAVRVSLDAFDVATHDKYHSKKKSDFHQVLENIEWMLSHRHHDTAISVGILVYDSVEDTAARAGLTVNEFHNQCLIPLLRAWKRGMLRMVQVRPVYEFKNQAKINEAWLSWEMTFNSLRRLYPEEASIVAAYSSHQQDGISKPRTWGHCHMTNVQTTLGANSDAFVCCAMAIKYGQWYEGDVCKFKDIWLSEGRRIIEREIDPFKPECASCTMSAFNNVLDHVDDFASEIF